MVSGGSQLLLAEEGSGRFSTALRYGNGTEKRLPATIPAEDLIAATEIDYRKYRSEIKRLRDEHPLFESRPDISAHDYEACLSRIRACRAPVREKPRKRDIDRILYARGQEEPYDSDELYVLFQELDPQRVADLRHAIRNENWHLMGEDQREAFLLEKITRPATAVRYVVALGKRDLLWDLLTDQIAKNVLEVRHAE